MHGSRGFFLAVSLLAVPQLAAAQESDTVSQALALHAAGKPDEAYKLLQPEVSVRAGQPQFDYALGLAAADSGQYGEAIIALQRVLSVEPNNAPARAELARVYALAGDIDTARREFDTVTGDPTIPDPVRNRFNRLVRDFDTEQKGGAKSLTGFVEAEGGYDGNINTATDATSITLPAFAFLGPATLGGAATSMDKGFGQIQAGLSASTPVSRQTRLYLSGLGSYRDNVKDRLFDQASLTGTAGLAHSLHNGDALSLSGQVQRFWLGHNGFRTSYGAVAQYTKRLSGNRALSVAAQYFRLDFDGNPLADANRYGASVSYSGRQLYASIGAGKEETVRKAGDHLSHVFASAQAGGEFALSQRLALLAGASIEHRNYDANDPLFLKSRKDTQLDGSLGLRYALKKGLSVRPRVTYTRNFSNIALNDYDRVTASLGVRFEF